MSIRMGTRFLDCEGMGLEEATQWGEDLCKLQRDVPWMLGDLARYCESKWPGTWQQAFPEWASPGMIDRMKGVAQLYPSEDDRRFEATFTQYLQCARRTDRAARLESIVAQGLTTDESRVSKDNSNGRRRWLVALDLHYFIHRRYYSGAGVETATLVAEWVRRTMERLKAKGATDCLCAFEGAGSFRRQLTEGDEWADHRYKASRVPKPEDLKHQIQLARTLLEGMGFCCVDVPDHEADDVLASAARQFPGNVTIVSSDKDLRQCLSDRCNILLDIEWIDDPSTGEEMPEYKWLTSDMHFQETGILPARWADYQTIMGDAVDYVQGVEGIGEKGAADLVQAFCTVEAAIKAAKDGDQSIREKKREALIAFEGRLAVTRRLVTLVDTCPIPANTRF